MKINIGYILSAGKGTRMGEIGKSLPKPLWPIFDKTLLELQIRYCHDLGINNIYINVHFLADEIIEFKNKNPEVFSGVKILKEDPLLDSGGAIHNLAAQEEINYSGNVLLLNADQFLFIDKKTIAQSSSLDNQRSSLFGIKVSKSSHYNETLIIDSKLKLIQKPSGEEDFWTYSGTGILNLKGLKKVEGVSRFFESVANFREEEIGFVCPDKFEYWDFGTLSIYAESMFSITEKIINDSDDEVVKFLKKHVDIKRVEDYVNLDLRSIDLEGSRNFIKNSVVKKNIVVAIP